MLKSNNRVKVFTLTLRVFGTLLLLGLLLLESASQHTVWQDQPGKEHFELIEITWIQAQLPRLQFLDVRRAAELHQKASPQAPKTSSGSHTWWYIIIDF